MKAATRGRRFKQGTRVLCQKARRSEIGDPVAVSLEHPTSFTIRLEPGPEMSEIGLERVRAKLLVDTYVHGTMKVESFPKAVETGRNPCEIVPKQSCDIKVLAFTDQ